MPDELPARISPPPEIRPIVGLIGEAAALDLVRHFGGLRIQVPMRVTAGSALAQAIGLPAARLLAAEYRGTKLSVPLCKRWQMRQLRAEGRSYREIAVALRTTEGVVYKVLRDGGMTRQMELPGL